MASASTSTQPDGGLSWLMLMEPAGMVCGATAGMSKGADQMPQWRAHQIGHVLECDMECGR